MSSLSCQNQEPHEKEEGEGRRGISGWIWDEHVNMIYSLRESLTTQHLLLSQQEIIDLKVRSNFIALCFYFLCVWRVFFVTTERSIHAGVLGKNQPRNSTKQKHLKFGFIIRNCVTVVWFTDNMPSFMSVRKCQAHTNLLTKWNKSSIWIFCPLDGANFSSFSKIGQS